MNFLIATYLMDFNPGYSLTGIIYDQTKMLTKYGHKVTLLVSEQFNPKGMDFSHVEVLTRMPFSHLTDYQRLEDMSEDHKQIASKTAAQITDIIEAYEIDVIFAHDLTFTGWFLPYGLGLVEVARNFPDLPVLHWVHSIPSGYRDWWNVRTWKPNNFLIFPNETDRIRVAEQYRGGPENVRVIPHIKDIRHWLNFSQDTCELIGYMPNLLNAGVVCAIPAGTDRLSSKGIDPIIRIMAGIKKQGASVCLVIANQWATGRQRKQTLEPYISLGEEIGLRYGIDFTFSSDLKADWANGLPGHMVRELFQLSNIFIFPTFCESFGLVVPEAALTGVLPILNNSLAQQKEIAGNNGLFFDFGSHVVNFQPSNKERYYQDLATIILGRLNQNEALRAKTFCRRYYNYDYLYRTYYLPTINELRFQLKDEGKKG